MRRSISIALLSIGVPLSAAGQSKPADLVLVNGRIFTTDSSNRTVEAVAITGERVLAVGTSAQIAALAGPRTRRIDLQGRLAVPGFHDAHFHFMPDPKGFRLQFRSREPTWEETKAAIEEAAKGTPEGNWIFGRVGHELVLDSTVTRFALDEIAPRHPVLLRSNYGHGYIVNSRAMPLLQIAEEEPDPPGGFFERVSGSKRVNGRFGEYAEWKPNRILADQASDKETVGNLKALAAEAAGYGITSMRIMSSLPVDRFARLLVKADLSIRVRTIPFSMTTKRGRDLTEIRQLRALRYPGSKVTVSGIKWVLDGTPFERGAALRRDYADRPGWRGRLNFSETEIAAMVKESLDFDQPLLMHCAGDRTAEAVLQAMEAYGSRVDWPRRRARIEHGDGVIDDLIPRARKLGVIVVQNPTHFSEPGLFSQRWGTKMQPLRSLVDAGIPVALGSDGPMNPFLNILFAATHPSNPKEAITREQAVRAYTYVPAFAEFSENEKGTLAPGKLADLAVLSQDIFAAPLPDLPKTTSVLTIVGGKIVHDSGLLK